MKINSSRRALSRSAKALLCFRSPSRTTSKTEAADHISPTTEPSRLESLPAELRSQILSCLASLDDLKAAAHASPVLYQQYRADRKPILDRVLRTTLGEHVFVDAFAAQKSAQFEHPPYLAAHLATQLFMHTYQEHRAQPALVANECTAADVIGMATFYWSTVVPLMQEIPQRLLWHLDPSLEPGRLSGVERERILRALYRFEMWCNLYGTTPGATAGDKSVHPVEMLMYFFQVFEPWEIEEISCIHTLLMDMYDHIFVDLKLHFHELTNRAPDVWAPRAWATNNLGNSPDIIDQFRHRNAQLNSLVSRGLEFQLEIMKAKKANPANRNPPPKKQHTRRLTQQLTTLIHPPTLAAGHNTIQDALSTETQSMRRALHRSAADRAQERGERLRVIIIKATGPCGRHRDRAEAPSLGWVVRWRGRRGNEYGQGTPVALRLWGYVFWDCARLSGTSGKEVVRRAARERGGLRPGVVER